MEFILDALLLGVQMQLLFGLDFLLDLLQHLPFVGNSKVGLSQAYKACLKR